MMKVVLIITKLFCLDSCSWEWDAHIVMELRKRLTLIIDNQFYSAEKDDKDMKDRPLRGPGGREFKGLKDIFTDDTKSKQTNTVEINF